MTISSAPRYAVLSDWEQLPDGWTHPDVAGVAVDSRDRVFLFSRAEHPLTIYDRDGALVDSWDRHAGLFGRPHGITVGPDDSVYCTDDGNHTVRAFSAAGELLFTIGRPDQPSDTGYTGKLETIARGGAPFNRPTNLAVGPNGDLYVSDGYGNARVHRFDSGGQHTQSWGEPGSGRGQFNLPHGIWATPDGRVLVADRENDRIQVFSLDGEPLDDWTNVYRPTSLVGDRDGRLYVSELAWWPGMKTNVPPANRRNGHPDTYRPGSVAILSADGSLLHRWGGEDPAAAGNFVAPHSIAVDSHGRVYVGEVTRTFGITNGVVGDDCHTFQAFDPIP